MKIIKPLLPLLMLIAVTDSAFAETGSQAAGCPELESTLRGTIERSGYCVTDEDCQNLGAVCPFGCNVVVHFAEASILQPKLKDYSGKCTPCSQSCAGQEGKKIKCKKDGTCGTKD